MSEGSKFHSCGAETEKPLLPDRSFRYRGTRSWAWDDDRRLRLAGMSFTEWQSSIKYTGARPARQLLVMEFSLYWIRNWIGSQWRSLELQPRSDHICQFWGSNVQQSWGPIGDGGRHLSHREAASAPPIGAATARVGGVRTPQLLGLEHWTPPTFGILTWDPLWDPPMGPWWDPPKISGPPHETLLIGPPLNLSLKK